MWSSFSTWLQDYRIGDLASIVGLLISIIGFIGTFIGIWQSRRAAERAEEAVTRATEKIRLFETVVDFTSAIATLEEIKRAHRLQRWEMLPDRYASMRKLLIVLRTNSGSLSEAQLTSIQGALANLRVMEDAVERGLHKPDSLKPARFNALLSTDIENLTALLAEMKRDNAGA